MVYLSIPFKIDSHGLPVTIQAKRPYILSSIPKFLLCNRMAVLSLCRMLNHNFAYSTWKFFCKVYKNDVLTNEFCKTKNFLQRINRGLKEWFYTRHLLIFSLKCFQGVDHYVQNRWWKSCGNISGLFYRKLQKGWCCVVVCSLNRLLALLQQIPSSGLLTMLNPN